MNAMMKISMPINANTSAAMMLPRGTRFILFASGVVMVAAVNGTIRAGIVANGFRNVFQLADPIEAPAAVLGVTGTAEDQQSISKVEFFEHQSLSPDEESCRGGWSLSAQRARSKLSERQVMATAGMSNARNAMPKKPGTVTSRVTSTEYAMDGCLASLSGSMRK